jgi:hypothetical protein
MEDSRRLVASLNVDGHWYEFIRFPHPRNQHIKILRWQPIGCDAVQEIDKTCSRVALKKSEALADDLDVATAIRRFNLPRRVAAKVAPESSDGLNIVHISKAPPKAPSKSEFEKPNSTRKQQYLKRLVKYTRAQAKAAKLLDHIPNACIITTKLGLLQTMRGQSTKALVSNVGIECSCADVRSMAAAVSRVFPFMPEAYRLDREEECLAVLGRHKQLVEAGVREGVIDPILWILKPSGGCAGKGIRLLGEADLTLAVAEACAVRAAAEDCASAGQGATNKEHARRLKASLADQMVVQRYLCRPLLLKGRKFDLRCFCLVARTAPSWLLYFHHGFARLSLEEYSLDSAADPMQRHVHLTNVSVQKAHPNYTKTKVQGAPGAGAPDQRCVNLSHFHKPIYTLHGCTFCSIWSMDDLAAYLESGEITAVPPGWILVRYSWALGTHTSHPSYARSTCCMHEKHTAVRKAYCCTQNQTGIYSPKSHWSLCGIGSTYRGQ